LSADLASVKHDTQNLSSNFSPPLLLSSSQIALAGSGGCFSPPLTLPFPLPSSLATSPPKNNERNPTRKMPQTPLHCMLLPPLPPLLPIPHPQPNRQCLAPAAPRPHSTSCHLPIAGRQPATNQLPCKRNSCGVEGEDEEGGEEGDERGWGWG